MGMYPTRARLRAGAFLLLVLIVWTSFAIGIARRPACGAEGEEAVAAADSGAPAGEGEAKQTKSYFRWFVESSGLIGFVILCLSIYFVATVARLFFELPEQIVMPPESLDEYERLIQAQDITKPERNRMPSRSTRRCSWGDWPGSPPRSRRFSRVTGPGDSAFSASLPW